MPENTLFILGDSTSMTIGAEPYMYPFWMAENATWPESTTLVNCSQPGITSADACAFFFQHLKKFPSTRAVIVHLGTCDATSSEIRKGRYTWLRHIKNRLSARLKIVQERTRLRNRLLHFEWNGELDSSLEKPEDPSDFEYNLDRILKKCLSRSIPVILVRPKSNPLFLPGVGKGNFVFYSYVGIPAEIADRLKIPDPRFVRAMKLSEENRFTESAALYREILSKPEILSSSLEYPLIVVNNYAVAMAESGNTKEAEALFQLLLKERGIRREIILYNLAHLSRKEGNLSKYTELLKQSYESDSSLYRIRRPYLDAIDRLGRKYSKVTTLIDLHNLIDDECYVDHCHPLPEGQRKIAKHMLASLQAQKIVGHCKATIQNILYNLEHSMGNLTEFYTYFRAYATSTPEKIKQEVRRFQKRVKVAPSHEEAFLLQAASEELSMSIRYYLRHPLFSSLDDVLRFGPEYPSDMGRFPEFFLIRHIIPYLRVHENDSELALRFRPEIGILRRSDHLVGALPPPVVSLIASDIPPIDSERDGMRVNLILDKAKTLLIGHLRNGNQVYERMKTTIFWYFRETLRYGSHSRLSMRYDRTSLEYIAESLAVAGIFDKYLRLDKKEEILDMVGWLEETVTIHHEFAVQFSLNHGENRSLLQEYDQRLARLADKVEGIEEQSVHTGNISLLSR